MNTQDTKSKRKIVRWAIILAIAAAHFVVGIVALISSFSISMGDAGDPPPPPPSLFRELMHTLTDILPFPVVTYWPFHTPGLLGYIAFALNSLLWAVGIYFAGSFVLRRVRQT